MKGEFRNTETPVLGEFGRVYEKLTDKNGLL